MFGALGVAVTLVESQTQLLTYLDREIIERLHCYLRALGVVMRLGEEVSDCKINAESGQVVTRLESGKTITSDAVCIAVGRQSATAGLGLEKLGVVTVERGKVPVNENMQTSVSNIYAVGDVVGFPGLAATAGAQGRLAAGHAFGINEKHDRIPLPIGIYSIPEIACVGQTEAELIKQRIPYQSGLARFRETVRGQILGDEEGLLKILFNCDSQEILGVHIIGESATELIHIGQAAMALKGGLRYLRDAVFNYPTLAECYQAAAIDGYNKMCLAGRV
jgi:NAD(P) transhydrogenase